MISIVMSVYNGSTNIIEQLESINHQSVRANEVIIIDDNSTDDTVSIIENYIEDNKCENWRLMVNKQNIGWRKSFYKVINKAEGDIIFLCDQDDIWDNKKIEKMSRILYSNTKIELLVTNYLPLYEENAAIIPRRIVKTLKENEKVEQVDMGYNFMYPQRPGCVYCFRKNLIPVFNDLWNENEAHDALLWKIAMIRKTIYKYNYRSITFRRHSHNASDVNRFSVELLKSRINNTLNSLENIENYVMNNQNEYDDKTLKYLKKSKKAYILRKELFEDNRLINWILLSGYIKSYQSFKAYLGDLYIFLNNNYLQKD